MTDEVWVSSVLSNSKVGSKLGVRAKYEGSDWEPPSHMLGVASDELIQAQRRHFRGEKLPRSALPEALYVWSEHHWGQARDLFYAGAFLAVKGRLATLLSDFDLGGTEMIEFPIYEADKQTQLPGPFYILNFDTQKQSFVPEQSTGVRCGGGAKTLGYDLWSSIAGPQDFEIAVTPVAIQGADLWFEPALRAEIFMSGRLHDALLAVDTKLDFQFARARVLDQGHGA